MSTGLYAIKCKSNGKSYIGVALNLQKRKNQHFNGLLKNKHHNKPLQNAYNKYGKENFEFVILQKTDSYEFARELERQMLYSFFDDELFNTTNQSSGFMPGNDYSKNRIVSKETKDKIRNAHLGKKLTKEHREKISLGLIGNQYTKGYKHTEEAKQKQREASKGNSTRFKPLNVYVLNGIEYQGSIEASNKTGIPRTTILRYAEKNKNGWSTYKSEPVVNVDSSSK